MNFRKILFRVKDKFQNGVVSNHYKDIKVFIESDRLINESQLDKLLSHVKSNVPFYKNISQLKLEEFPIVDKSLIKGNFDDFRAKNYLNKKIIIMTTSGSTGTPFKVFQDLNKKARNHADTLYFGNLAGYNIGNRVIYMKIWAKQKMSHPFLYNLQNIIPVDVLNLDDKQLEKLVKKVEGLNKSYSVLGYVSALEQVVRYFEKNSKIKINAKIESVITMSEGLNRETKEKLQRLFDCPVVSRYSNLENGIIAQQECNDKERFLINTASYCVEILDINTNMPLKDGQLGKIVVTDLFNFAMPLVRYDTGDLGVIERDAGNLYLSRVEGRKLDILFDTKGNVVSSYIMYKNMWQYTEIDQYQLIQTGEKTYLFKINCPGKFKREEQLVNEFLCYLGNDAEFKVEYVNEIPLLDSGKRRKTVNLYKKTI